MLKSLRNVRTIKAGARVMYRYSRPSGIVKGIIRGCGVKNGTAYLYVQFDDGSLVSRQIESWELIK